MPVTGVKVERWCKSKRDAIKNGVQSETSAMASVISEKGTVICSTTASSPMAIRLITRLVLLASVPDERTPDDAHERRCVI